MRVVVDTNVLVSGILRPAGPPGHILDLVLTRRVTLLVSSAVLSEYREVLSREEFGFPKRSVDDLLHFIEAYAEKVIAAGRTLSLPDPQDTAFLLCAIEGRADFLITGNKKHFPASVCKPIRVGSTSEFLAIFSQSP